MRPIIPLGILAGLRGTIAQNPNVTQNRTTFFFKSTRTYTPNAHRGPSPIGSSTRRATVRAVPPELTPTAEAARPPFWDPIPPDVQPITPCPPGIPCPPLWIPGPGKVTRQEDASGTYSRAPSPTSSSRPGRHHRPPLDISNMVLESPESITKTCDYLQVSLGSSEEKGPSKSSFIQAACKSSIPGTFRWRCSKLDIKNCFANRDGKLVSVTDNSGRWTETCTDCTYNEEAKKIKCRCWKKDMRPNVSEIGIDEGIWAVNGMLTCGRPSKPSELALGKCFWVSH